MRWATIGNKNNNITKRYIITSAQANAAVNNEFYTSLTTYAKHLNAELLILPMQGKHVNEERLSKKLMQHELIYGNFKLNDKIKIRDFKVKPQAIRPLTGLESLVKGDKSAIIAGTKQNLRAVPNSNTRMAKLLMTTGAITLPNYNLKHRVGNIALQDHEYGAVIVEILDHKYYHVRQIRSLKNGKFYDLGTFVNGEDIVEGVRARSLICGDLHLGMEDKPAVAETIEMIKLYKPKEVFAHDLFNAGSISHHNINDLVALHRNYARNHLSLEEELQYDTQIIKQLLNTIPDDGKIYVVASNHNEALSRWLKEGRFIHEPQNAELGCELLKAMFNGLNPLEIALSYFMDIPENLIFLERGEDTRILGYELAEHGDRGPNGARGTPNNHSRTLEKSITGHSHSPFKFRNTYKVGTLCSLDQEYNQGGTSSWLLGNGLLHSNGIPQLIHIINGHHRGQ